jgi:hypothetical protein
VSPAIVLQDATQADDGADKQPDPPATGFACSRGGQDGVQAARQDPRVRSFLAEADAYLAEIEQHDRNR